MNTVKDELEFWVDGKLFASIESSFQPQIGEVVTIRDKHYKVTSRNFALDYSDDFSRRHMRLAVNMVTIIQRKKKA